MLRSSLLLLLSILIPSASAAEPTYWQDVRPILRKNCTVCHNPRNVAEEELSGGLSLDTYARVLRWSEKKRDLVRSGRATDSQIYKRLVATSADRRMPPGGKSLPPDDVASIRRWIDSGAREGQRPAETAIVPGTRRPRRKLDVLLTTVTPEKLTLGLRIGPLAPVVALAYHPDGRRLAVGSYGKVTIWDLQKALPEQTLSNVLGAVNDLRFSPDGKRLAVAGGQPSARGDLRLFTAADWKLDRVLAGHDDVVGGVAFNPEGSKLASASYDRTVRVWELPSGKLERTITSHSDFVYAVTFTPDGQGVLTVSKDRTARLIETSSGSGKYTFGDREEEVLGVAAHPTSKLAVVCGREPALTWWNTETGLKMRTVGGHRGAVHELAFSRDGKTLVSAGSDGRAILWDGVAGTLRRALPVGSLVYAVAISPDGKTVATGSFDGLVRIFDTATGNLRGTLLSVGADHLALSPAGYAEASEGFRQQGRWTARGKALAAERTWKTAAQPALVVQSLAGRPVPPVKIPAK